MRGEKAGRGGGGRQVGVETEDHVGVGSRAFEPDAGKQRRTVAGGDELQVAAAGFLERRFDRRAGTPIRR